MFAFEVAISMVAGEAPSAGGERSARLIVPWEMGSITRQGKAIIPLTGTEFREEDLLHLAVAADSMSRLRSMLGMGGGD
jgi:hypothetical protein